MALHINKLIIIGAGGHARVVIDAAKLAGYEIIGIIDTGFKGQQEKILDVKILGDISSLDEWEPREISVFVSVGGNSERAQLYYHVKEKGFSTPSVIHPTAIISDHSLIGSGVLINAAAIINAGAKIGENAIINTATIIEHEVAVGKHCHICSGVNIGGRTRIGESTFIGIGSSVKDFVTIGANVIIGAGSVIINNVKTNTTVVGVPGRQIK